MQNETLRIVVNAARGVNNRFRLPVALIIGLVFLSGPLWSHNPSAANFGIGSYSGGFPHGGQGASPAVDASAQQPQKRKLKAAPQDRATAAAVQAAKEKFQYPDIDGARQDVNTIYETLAGKSPEPEDAEKLAQDLMKTPALLVDVVTRLMASEDFRNNNTDATVGTLLQTLKNSLNNPMMNGENAANASRQDIALAFTLPNSSISQPSISQEDGQSNPAPVQSKDVYLALFPLVQNYGGADLSSRVQRTDKITWVEAYRALGFLLTQSSNASPEEAAAHARRVIALSHLVRNFDAIAGEKGVMSRNDLTTSLFGEPYTPASEESAPAQRVIRSPRLPIRRGDMGCRNLATPDIPVLGYEAIYDANGMTIERENMHALDVNGNGYNKIRTKTVGEVNDYTFGDNEIVIENGNAFLTGGWYSNIAIRGMKEAPYRAEGNITIRDPTISVDGNGNTVAGWTGPRPDKALFGGSGIQVNLALGDGADKVQVFATALFAGDYIPAERQNVVLDGQCGDDTFELGESNHKNPTVPAKLPANSAYDLRGGPGTDTVIIWDKPERFNWTRQLDGAIKGLSNDGTGATILLSNFEKAEFHQYVLQGGQLVLVKTPFDLGQISLNNAKRMQNLFADQSAPQYTIKETLLCSI
jgi:hypothetical protein